MSWQARAHLAAGAVASRDCGRRRAHPAARSRHPREPTGPVAARADRSRPYRLRVSESACEFARCHRARRRRRAQHCDRAAAGGGHADRRHGSRFGRRRAPRNDGEDLRAVLFREGEGHGSRTGPEPLDRREPRGALVARAGRPRDLPGEAAAMSTLPGGSARALTVFVVDDDADVREALGLLLSLRGYRTALFDSANAFLAQLRPDSAGCLITDIRMPGMSGLELQQELAKRCHTLPVVVLTAHGSVATARAALRAEAIDFLAK